MESVQNTKQAARVNHHQVVVIGAGVAGLAAAQRLHDLGIKDVVLLEAQNRVGGRVHTIEHGDYLLELGAQWLHGANQNPLYQWMNKLDLLDDFENASAGFQGMYCGANNELIDVKLVERVLDIVYQSKSYLSNKKIDNNNNDDDNDTLLNNSNKASQVFRDYLAVTIKSDPELSKQQDQVWSLFEWFLRYETIENGCNNMDEVSIASYTDYTEWADGTLLNFKKGYKSLLQWFCKKFPANEWIQLKRQVTQIELLTKDDNFETHWRDDSGRHHKSPVLLQYKRRSNDDDNDDDSTNLSNYEVMECDHVIVTCSLGFLKQNHEKLFKPQLETWRKGLINSIGFGTVNKILLQFESPFWTQGIKLVWPSANGESKLRDIPTWARSIIAFDMVRRQPNMLIGWIGGEGAKELERYTDQEVAKVCLDILDRFLPENYKRPTKLIDCFCTRWNSNHFTCGSYTFQSMESFNLNVQDLHKPIYERGVGDKMALESRLVQKRAPRIMFAGEATADMFYSTTHGAIMSGWREANRLKNHLNDQTNNNQESIEISAEKNTRTTPISLAITS